MAQRGRKPDFLYEYKKRKQSLSAWAKEFGIPANTLYARIGKLGWTMHKALTTPVRSKATPAA